MKLRTRIVWISIVVIFISLLVGDMIIGVIWYNNMRREAFLASMQEIYYTAGDIDKYIDSDEYLRYYFKHKKDDLSVCYRDWYDNNGNKSISEVYNHTVFDYNKLNSFDYGKTISKEYAVYNITSGNCSYAYMTHSGRYYLVIKFEFTVYGIEYFKMVDITYIRADILKRMVFMLIVTVAITFVASVVINILVKKVFKPLDRLNVQAKQMADGVYDKRVSVDTQDEIGQLGANFNLMADAVEARTISLEESEKNKTLMMGNLTHELRTPMTAISGYSELLLTTKLSDEDREEALMYINSECKRLEKLSSKMVKLLSVDNESEIKLSEVKAKDVFDISGKALSVKLKESDISLIIEESGETFMADFDLMVEVLINLVDNAIKASDRGSRIILRADGNKIEVEDFGKGIPADEIEKILEPFYMVDKSRSRRSGGAGLGLALVAAILKKHSCTLDIESEVNNGTKMILQFV